MPAKPSMKSIQESLDSFRDDYKNTVAQLLQDILVIKDTIMKDLLDENKCLKERVKLLEENNDKHQDHIIDIEKQSQVLEQYTCHNNLEISGIPTYLMKPWKQNVLKSLKQLILVLIIPKLKSVIGSQRTGKINANQKLSL